MEFGVCKNCVCICKNLKVVDLDFYTFLPCCLRLNCLLLYYEQFGYGHVRQGGMWLYVCRTW